MTESAYDPPGTSGRPYQGSVYHDVSVSLLIPSEDVGGLDLKKLTLEYAVVMTQDCDLEKDHTNRSKLAEAEEEEGDHDKCLPSILVCPGSPSLRFKEGSHLEPLGLRMKPKSRKELDKIQHNRTLRYHFLSQEPTLLVPDLVIDFKHIFTVSTDLLRERYAGKKHHIARLKCPYREDLSQRFAAFLSRVGLPFEHHNIMQET